MSPGPCTRVLTGGLDETTATLRRRRLPQVRRAVPGVAFAPERLPAAGRRVLVDLVLGDVDARLEVARPGRRVDEFDVRVILRTCPLPVALEVDLDRRRSVARHRQRLVLDDVVKLVGFLEKHRCSFHNHGRRRGCERRRRSVGETGSALLRQAGGQI